MISRLLSAGFSFSFNLFTFLPPFSVPGQSQFQSGCRLELVPRGQWPFSSQHNFSRLGAGPSPGGGGSQSDAPTPSYANQSASFPFSCTVPSPQPPGHGCHAHSHSAPGHCDDGHGHHPGCCPDSATAAPRPGSDVHHQCGGGHPRPHDCWSADRHRCAIACSHSHSHAHSHSPGDGCSQVFVPCGSIIGSTFPQTVPFWTLRWTASLPLSLPAPACQPWAALPRPSIPARPAPWRRSTPTCAGCTSTSWRISSAPLVCSASGIAPTPLLHTWPGGDGFFGQGFVVKAGKQRLFFYLVLALLKMSNIPCGKGSKE